MTNASRAHGSPKLAGRLDRLGTETAFAVSAEASAMAAAGHTVYPFHIGDYNLNTPQHIIDTAFRAAQSGKTGYCPVAGIPQLREQLAEHCNASRGTHYTMENVAIQPGGKPTIGKCILALTDPGDEVLLPNPGFPIYESQINFHGGRAVPYRFGAGKDSFDIDLDYLADAITSHTRMLIYNNLHNPTGTESSEGEMQAIAELAVRHDLWVLSDEAYFDIRYQGQSRSIAALPGMEERTVILYSFGKRFAMTGWRIGAAVGPQAVIDVVATLNVNDESCTNHFTQYGALAALTEAPDAARRIVDTLRRRRDAASRVLETIPGVHCYLPQTTFYLYPDVTDVMRRKGLLDYESFRQAALRETGVSFCTRAHFGAPFENETRRYVRLAYAGIDEQQIEEGLGRFQEWVML